MSHTFGQLLVKQGKGGSIVNISSIGGKWMAARTAAYAASKAGIHALTAAMSGEVGPPGVRVNAICPGIIDTYRMDDIPRGQAWQDLIANNVPLGRAGKRRGHRLDGRVPLLRPGLVDHRTAVHDRRWDAARSMSVPQI